MAKVTKITEAQPVTTARTEKAQEQLVWNTDTIEQAALDAPSSIDLELVKEQAARLFAVYLSLDVLRKLTGHMGKGN